MTRVSRFALPLLVALALIAGPAHAETPKSTSVADRAGDQNHGDLWDEFPALRPASDLRRAVFSTSSGTLTLAFAFEAFPAHKRAFQTVSMSGRLWNKQMTFTAWRRGDQVYTSVSSGLGDESKYYCQGQASVSVMPKKKRVVMKVPVSCLPPGKVVRGPYPATGVTVLRKNGVVKGYVGTDSSVAAPDFALRG